MVLSKDYFLVPFIIYGRGRKVLLLQGEKGRTGDNAPFEIEIQVHKESNKVWVEGKIKAKRDFWLEKFSPFSLDIENLLKGLKAKRLRFAYTDFTIDSEKVGLASLPEERQSKKSHLYGLFSSKRRKSLLIGAIEPNHKSVVEYTGKRIEAYSQIERKLLKGDLLYLDRWVIIEGNSFQEVLESYAALFRAVPQRFSSNRVNGWNSWDYYFCERRYNLLKRKVSCQEYG